MRRVLISLMFVLLFMVGSCSEKSKMTGLCEKGDKEACAWVEHYSLCDNGKSGNIQACEWLKAKENCDKNDNKGCMLFGEYWYSGTNNTSQDMEIATKYFRKGCSGQEKETCYNIAKELSTKIESVIGAALFFKLSCENGISDACFYYGIMLLQSKTIRADIGDKLADSEGTKMIRESCDKGSAKGCSFAGDISKNADEEKAYREKGCELGGIISCALLSNYYAKDPDKVISILKKQDSYKKDKIFFYIVGTRYENMRDYLKSCESISIPGYWRVAAIDELRTLIQNCPSTETGGDCEVSPDCLEQKCQNKACTSCEYSFWSIYTKSDLLRTDNIISCSSSRHRIYDVDVLGFPLDEFWHVNFMNASIVLSWNSGESNKIVFCVSKEGEKKESKLEEVKEEVKEDAEEKAGNVAAVAIPQPSFNCDKAATFVEKTICGNATLAGYDKELAEEYKAILKNPEKKTEVRDSQRNWIKERNTCKDEECLINSYKKRLGDLKGMR
jgi:TPR repeat protein/uncharacterized protein YecT (DUF1311 family)